MAEIIRKREQKHKTEYAMNFYRKDTNEICFGFPMVDGKVVPLSDEGMKNYLRVKEDESFYSEIEKTEVFWTEPAVAICECGNEITLNYDAEECSFCGRLHNLFGQELLPRNMWEEDFE